MHGVLTIMLASVFAVKASQLSIIADKNNVKDGERVVLTCTVPDFSDNLFVKQNSINKAVCIGSDPCTASNSEHNASRSGSTNVIFTILSFSKIRDEGQWLISYGNTESTPITLSAFTESPTLQTSTLLATERPISVNSILEYNNITSPMITGDITSTRDISTSTISYSNTATTNIYANTESSKFYTNTETTNSYANTETTNFYANTEIIQSWANSDTANVNSNIVASVVYANTKTNEIQTETSGTKVNAMSATAAIYISGSVFPNTTSQNMTEKFASPVYSVLKLTSAIKTNNFLSKTLETTFSYSMNTQSDILFYTLDVSSSNPSTYDSPNYSIFFMTIFPSHVVDPYIASSITPLSAPSLATDTSGSAFDIPYVSRVSSFPLITETKQTPVTSSTFNSSAVNTILNSERSENLLLSLSVNHSNFQEIFTSKEYSWMSITSVIDNISCASKMLNPSFTSNTNASETSVTLPNDSEGSQLQSSIIDTMNHFIYTTTNTLITSYLDDTSHSFDNFTGGFQTFSQDYAASVSTSLGSFFQSTDHNLSLQTTEYHATMQTEFTSYVTTSFYESLTYNAATGKYSTEIVTSGNYYMQSSVMRSQTQLASMNDIYDSTIDFQSTHFDPYSQSNDEVFSSEISGYLSSTLQSTSLLLPFNTNATASGVDSYMKTTKMSTFESQSGILTMDRSIFANPSSILISTSLLDFKTTWVTTTINFKSKTMPSMIKPSSQQKSSGNSYLEIDSSFKDSSFSFGSFSGSLTSKYPVMTSLPSGVSKSMSTLSTNTVQSGLGEKNKRIIFISTISAVLTTIVVILLIIFAKVYMSKINMKPYKEDDKKGWSNNNSPPKTALPDYSFTGKIIYPLFNTSTTSLKMNPYEHNWNDIV